jgi:hypothetical protein
MAIQDCGITVGCQGYFFRAANILLNGNAQAYSGTSQAAALGYFQGGVVLTGGCPIVGSDVSQNRCSRFHSAASSKPQPRGWSLV